MLNFRQTFSFEHALEQIQKAQATFVILTDPHYSQLLKQLVNPPFILYCRGNTSLLQDEQTIGIVGTRKITAYGEQVTKMLTTELVSAGFVIVSGLAMGVDACAHRTTLDTHGKTIAVLGCGVDMCYPHENQKIYDSILAKDSLMISEFPVSMQPSIGSFPSRNRIIAGLSHAVLVTEGAEDSGALITAADALQIGRKVFAVPGPITSSLSKGPNNLISKGAKLVTSAEEIIRELGIKNYELRTGKKTIKKEIRGATKEEQVIIDLLENEALAFDEIVKQTRVIASRIGTLLSIMELKGRVKKQSSGTYILENN